jgi:hypothetical protein
MQRRLLISMIAVAAVAILAVGIPLSFALSRSQANQASADLRRDARTMAVWLRNRLDDGLPPNATQLARALAPRYVLVEENGLPPVHFGATPTSNVKSGTWTTGDFTVTVEADESGVIVGLIKDLLLTGIAAVLCVALAVGLGVAYTRRLARGGGI